DMEIKYDVVVDRREAIAHAMQTAQPGDVIVLAGKGHEDYQIFANNYHTHFDEREVVAEILKQMQS
ncbi:MAG: UDP-N-acetylmuramoyl-L-alanyl-D-glutamate--2,6-diaminopimelate ligase, partial [Oscillospiraceae bacterium]|nr:UDP-N-acetylmuramoyl-L-alanyl-D-glutamate--2,6-diaminopimelate ligase [Oscillospiraceae bacterium]